jgi:hypothetical protein
VARARQPEEVFYDDGEIQVTSSRLVMPDRVYALANITSARHFTDSRQHYELPTHPGLIGGMAGGFILAFACFAGLTGTDPGRNEVAAVFFGTLFVLGFLAGLVCLIAIGVLTKRKRVWQCGIELCDSSGRGEEVILGPPRVANAIYEAVNEAIVARGER